MAGRKRTPQEHEDLFWGKVDKTNTCWNWKSIINNHGYGIVIQNYKRLRAHRVAYEYVKGTIPDGYQIDHICENKICVNPEHLRAVTHEEHKEHTARQMRKAMLEKTHCSWGHPLDNDNGYLYTGPQGRKKWKCRLCRKRYYNDSHL